METRRAADHAFEEFWASYPRKVGKLAAKREWDKLRPTADLVTQISAALAWQVPTWNDPAFIPHPRTWLHQGRWLDEPPAKKAAPVRSYATWECPHLEQCAHRAMCEVKLTNPQKYPVKVAV